MVTQKLLLPYNFTPSDRAMLDFVVRTFSQRGDIEITLFHSYTPVPEIKPENSSVMGRMKENLRHLTQIVSERESGLKDVGKELAGRGFGDDKVNYQFKARKKDIASEIIDIAVGGHFDVVILNRKPGRVARFFSGSTYSKVISGLQGVTVCVVS